MPTSRRLRAAWVVCALMAVWCPGLWGQSESPTFPEQWRDLDVAGLTALARQFTGGDNADQAKLLAAYVAQRYEAEAGAGAVDWNQWLELATVLGPQYPPATQDAMASALRSTLAPTPAATAQLPAAKVMQLRQALWQLSKPALMRPVAADWVSGSDTYKTCDAATLRHLANDVSQATGDQAKTARTRLSALLEEQYFADAAKMRALGAGAWKDYARFLLFDAGAPQRKLWGDKLIAAFAADDTAIGSLSQAEAADVAFALRRLMDKRGGAIMAAWVQQHPDVPAADPKVLVEQAMALAKAGAAGRESRSRLGARIGSDYLADAAKTRSVGIKGWVTIAKALSADLSAESKALWASKFREVYAASNEVVAGLSAADVLALSAVLGSLGDAQTGALVSHWICSNTAWQSLRGEELVVLIRGLGGQAGQPGRARLIEHLGMVRLADAAGVQSVGLPSLSGVVTALGSNLPAADRQAWRQKLRAAFASPSNKTLLLMLLRKREEDDFRLIVYAYTRRDIRTVHEGLELLDDRR